MTRKIMIQPSVLPNHEMPKPYYVLANGDIDRQDAWKGDPAGLIGFRDHPGNALDITHKQFWDEPHLAHGRYPVFARDRGNPYALKIAITGVRLVDPDIPDGYPHRWINPLGWSEAKGHGIRPVPNADRAQIGIGHQRRFVKRLLDGEWAVLEVTFYATEPQPDQLLVTRRSDLYVCTDPTGPLATYRTLATVREEAARLGADSPDRASIESASDATERTEDLCDRFELDWITWNGLPFDDSANKPIAPDAQRGDEQTRC